MPDTDEKEEFSLPQYKEDFLTCRTFGHSWKVTFEKPTEHAPSTRVMVLTCRSCGTKRVDTVSISSGEIYARTYTYPEGYRHSGQTYRSEYRLEILVRHPGAT